MNTTTKPAAPALNTLKFRTAVRAGYNHFEIQDLMSQFKSDGAGTLRR